MLPGHTIFMSRAARRLLAAVMVLGLLQPYARAGPILRAAGWLDYSPKELAASFPAIGGLGPMLSSGPGLLAMRRVLSLTDLPPRAVMAQPPALQAEKLRAAVYDYAASWCRDAATARADGGATQAVVDLNAKRAQARDLLLVIEAADGAGRPPLAGRVKQLSLSIDRQAFERNRALVEETALALSDPKRTTRFGRTSVVTLADGGKVAFKFSKAASPNESLKALAHDASMMELTASFGLDNPIPLRHESGATYAMPESLRPSGAGERAMPYLLPAALANDFFSYLGDPLPKRMDRQEKARAVEAAALRAVDDMNSLSDNGYLHTSLAPISHSEATWSWSYWRWKLIGFPGKPFGPTSIHNWKSALSYANLRLSGMADYEHIEKISDLFPGGRDQPGYPYLHDSYLAGYMGQNLTEWALLVMRAGAENGLSAETTARILQRGIQRHAANQLQNKPYVMDPQVLLTALRSAVRWFYGFHRVALSVPRWLTPLVNVFSLGNEKIPAGERLVMPGSVTYSLIMDVIWPYAVALEGGSPRFGNQHESAGGNSMSGVRYATRPVSLLVTNFISGFMLWLPLLPILIWAGGAFAATLLFAPGIVPLTRIVLDSLTLLRRQYKAPWVRRAAEKLK